MEREEQKAGKRMRGERERVRTCEGNGGKERVNQGEGIEEKWERWTNEGKEKEKERKIGKKLLFFASASHDI